MTKLEHPFPDEPFGFNAFMVLFGREAAHAWVNTARKVTGFNADGSMILSPVNPTVIRRILELCTAHTGATVDEVKAFLANPSAKTLSGPPATKP